MIKEQFDLWRTEIELMTDTQQMMELRLRLRSIPSAVFERDLGLQMLETMVSQKLLVALRAPSVAAGYFLDRAAELLKPGSRTSSWPGETNSPNSSRSNHGSKTPRLETTIAPSSSGGQSTNR